MTQGSPWMRAKYAYISGRGGGCDDVPYSRGDRSVLGVARCVASPAQRGRFLRQEDHHHDRRRQSRRRLRPLCPRAGAPLRQAYSGRADDRRPAHARRRQRQSRQPSLCPRAEGRTDHRHDLSGRGRRPAARRAHGGALQADRVHLSRQRQQLDPGLRDLSGLRDHDVRRRAQARDRHGRRRARRLAVRLPAIPAARGRREIQGRARLQGQRRYPAVDGARRGRGHLRARLVEPAHAAAGLGARQPHARDPADRDRHPCRAGGAGRAQYLELREGRREPPRARADPRPAGVRPAVQAAARRAGGPRRDPAQGVRRHHGRQGVCRRRREDGAGDHAGERRARAGCRGQDVCLAAEHREAGARRRCMPSPCGRGLESTHG